MFSIGPSDYLRLVNIIAWPDMHDKHKQLELYMLISSQLHRRKDQLSGLHVRRTLFVRSSYVCELRQ